MENLFLKGCVDGIVDIGDLVLVEKVVELKFDLIIVLNDDEFEVMLKIVLMVLILYVILKNVEEDVC